jgi:glycerol-3-phosphate cytidylyltransferase
MIIGYTTGVFDLFHVGHLNMLRNAKSMCDRLLVGITADELLFPYKGKRAVIPFMERMEIVRAVRYVDAVIPQLDMDKYQAWEKIKFDRLFVGDDWYRNPKWNVLEKQLKKVGVRIVYFPYTQGTSSTLITKTLADLRKKHSR